MTERLNWAELNWCLLWRSVYLGLLSTCWLGWLFFWYWATWAACIFWRSVICQLFHLLLFSPILRAVFTLLIVSFVVQKLLSYLGLICLFLLFSPLGFNHVPSSAGCFSVILFCLIYYVWDPFFFFKLKGCSSSLEKAMATHSSTLAWKIPWSEEPGGLLSMGSHRVRHNWSDLGAAAVAVPLNYGVYLPWVGLDQCLVMVSWLGGFVCVFW